MWLPEQGNKVYKRVCVYAETRQCLPFFLEVIGLNNKRISPRVEEESAEKMVQAKGKEYDMQSEI